ncbi:hypothetical protein P7C70_g7417, partial [Phenoliferia sp. Uapishka_3]
MAPPPSSLPLVWGSATKPISELASWLGAYHSDANQQNNDHDSLMNDVWRKQRFRHCHLVLRPRLVQTIIFRIVILKTSFLRTTKVRKGMTRVAPMEQSPLKTRVKHMISMSLTAWMKASRTFNLWEVKITFNLITTVLSAVKVTPSFLELLYIVPRTGSSSDIDDELEDGHKPEESDDDIIDLSDNEAKFAKVVPDYESSSNIKEGNSQVNDDDYNNHWRHSADDFGGEESEQDLHEKHDSGYFDSVEGVDDDFVPSGHGHTGEYDATPQDNVMPRQQIQWMADWTVADKHIRMQREEIEFDDIHQFQCVRDERSKHLELDLDSNPHGANKVQMNWCRHPGNAGVVAGIEADGYIHMEEQLEDVGKLPPALQVEEAARAARMEAENIAIVERKAKEVVGHFFWLAVGNTIIEQTMEEATELDGHNLELYDGAKADTVEADQMAIGGIEVCGGSAWPASPVIYDSIPDPNNYAIAVPQQANRSHASGSFSAEAPAEGRLRTLKLFAAVFGSQVVDVYRWVPVYGANVK